MPKKDVVSIETAIKMFDCSRPQFYRKYKSLLKPLPKIGRKVYYELEDVEKVIKRINKPTADYNIVE